MNVNDIIERFKADKEFAEKYSSLQSLDAILKQAKNDGYDVTKDDLMAVINEMRCKKGELSEVELAAVSGGGKGWTQPADIPSAARADGHTFQHPDNREYYSCSSCGGYGRVVWSTPPVINGNYRYFESLRCYRCGYHVKGLTGLNKA